METLSVWQSLLISLWLAAVMSRALLGGATLTLRFSPLMTGLVIGWIMGDVKTAMIIATAILLVNLGVNSPGATMSSEPTTGAAIAIPVALIGNLSPETAIVLAMPISVLGASLYRYRFTINERIGKRTDRAAEALDHGEVSRSIVLYPTLASFVLFVPVTFVLLLWGAPLLANVLSYLEAPAIHHVLSVIVKGLIAVGIATRIYVIGKQEYLLFFGLAYVLAILLKPLQISMFMYAIVGAIIAAIFLAGSAQKAAEPNQATTVDMDDDDDDF